MKSHVSEVWRQIRCTCRLVQEVGQQAAHDSLVADNQHVFLPFQLHDHRLQTMDEVLIRLNGGETIIQTPCQVASRMTKVRFILILMLFIGAFSLYLNLNWTAFPDFLPHLWGNGNDTCPGLSVQTLLGSSPESPRRSVLHKRPKCDDTVEEKLCRVTLKVQMKARTIINPQHRSH